MPEPLLKISHIECRYRNQTVVNDFSINVNDGELFGLLGPSGCGKTTALRAIAGFEPVYNGTISIKNEIVSKPGYTLAPQKRKLGMVFQDYALFPHLNIYQNICFGISKLDASIQKARANKMLELVGMEEMQKRFPHELSGGQQQRVSLARALAPQPELLLLDEPFSSLDVERREKLQKQVRDILKQLKTTGIIVTHDQYEAFAMADMVGVMNNGKISQLDTPYNLYHQPQNRFVANFIGQGKFLRGTSLSPTKIETEVGIIASHKKLKFKTGAIIDVLLRPDDVIPDPDSKLEGSLLAQITQKAFKGAEILYTLRLPTGGEVLSLFPSHLNHNIGDRVSVCIAADHLVAFIV